MLEGHSSPPGRLLEWLEDAGEKVSFLALWAIVALVFFPALFRNILDLGLPWPDEVARFLHICVVFLCLGYVTRYDRHIRIDLFARKIAAPLEYGFRLFVLFFCAIVLAAGAGIVMLRIGGLRTPAAGMPIFLFFLPALLGFTTVALVCLWKVFTSDEPTDRGGREVGPMEIE